MIFLAGVDHRHQADRARVDDRQRNDRFLAENENVERIVVFGERLRNETIVRGIVDGGIQDAIELDEAADFIEFVFDARSEGNFDRQC